MLEESQFDYSYCCPQDLSTQHFQCNIIHTEMGVLKISLCTRCQIKVGTNPQLKYALGDAQDHLKIKFCTVQFIKFSPKRIGYIKNLISIFFFFLLGMDGHHTNDSPNFFFFYLQLNFSVSDYDQCHAFCFGHKKFSTISGQKAHNCLYFEIYIV